MPLKDDREFECNSAKANTAKLWHERLGHINLKYVKDNEK